MPEKDHNAPQPALPILGSVLLQNELHARTRFASHGDRVSTGCTEIDDHVLGGGGFERGIVVGINGIDESGRLVSQVINELYASVEVLQYESYILPPMILEQSR